MNVHDDELQRAADIALLEENPTEAVADEVALAEDEMAETSTLADNIAAQMEETVVVAESLEAFINHVFDTVGPDNWNSKVAQQYQTGVGAILTMAGVSVESNVYCSSFENAGVNETNQENRKSTVEKGKGMLKAVWDAVVKAVTSFLAMIGKYIGNVGNSGAAMRKAGTNLQAQAKEATGEPKKKEFDKVPSYATYLYKGTQMLRGDIALQAGSSTLPGYAMVWIDHYNTAINFVQKTLLAGKTLEEGGHINVGGAGIAVLKEQSLAGQIKISTDGAPTANDGPTWIAATAKMTIKSEADGVVGSGKVPVLTGMNITQIGKQLIAMADQMDEIKKRLDNVNKAMTATLNQAKAASGKPDSKVSGPELRLITGLVSHIMLGPKLILPLMAKQGRAAWSHANDSLKMYGGKPDKPTDTAVPDDKKPTEKPTEKAA